MRKIWFDNGMTTTVSYLHAQDYNMANVLACLDHPDFSFRDAFECSDEGLFLQELTDAEVAAALAFKRSSLGLPAEEETEVWESELWALDLMQELNA